MHNKFWTKKTCPLKPQIIWTVPSKFTTDSSPMSFLWAYSCFLLSAGVGLLHFSVNTAEDKPEYIACNEVALWATSSAVYCSTWEQRKEAESYNTWKLTWSLACFNYYSWLKRPGSFLMASCEWWRFSWRWHSQGRQMRHDVVTVESNVAISTGAACDRTKRSSSSKTAVWERIPVRQIMKLWEQADRRRRGHWDATHIHAWQVDKR